MTRYQFELATPADDQAIRRVMAETPMIGSVTVSFQREPSFFEANDVLGRDWQAVVCRDTKQDEIVGVATRSVRPLYVNGIPRRIGYLSGLRFVRHARGAVYWLVAFPLFGNCTRPTRCGRITI